MAKIALLLALAGIAVAQESAVTSTASSASPSATTATNTTNAPVTHTVGVAEGGFTYVPDVTLAEVGDIIEFDFYPTNHSVIRAEYGFPCIPYEDTGVDKIGFFSGFFPVDANIPNLPKWSVRVNDSNPIFYYCGAPGSCINHQMVGVINPNATTSLVVQKEKAANSSYMLLPGQPFPNEENSPTATASSTSSPTSTPTTSSAPAATTSAAADHKSSGLGAGAIAGIAIGAAAVALAAAVLLYLCGRQSRKNNNTTSNNNSTLPQHHARPSNYSQQPPGHGQMSYADPTKHMSTASTTVGPALPGYAPSEGPHTPTQVHGGHSMPSPPLVAYAPSDALNPGTSTRSTSPVHQSAVPAYSYHNYNMNNNMGAFGGPQQQPMAGIHEMAAAPVPDGQQGVGQQSLGQQGAGGNGQGIMGFLRNSGIQQGGTPVSGVSNVNEKGGVERYS